MWKVKVGCWVFFVLKNWVAVISLCSFSRQITILWIGLFFCGAKLLFVAIFLLIREAFLIICQAPLAPGIADLSYVHMM